MRALAFLIAGLGFSVATHAACQCACVNGHVEAICSSAIEVRPICAPVVCPIVPPAVTPIAPPRVPPIGTSYCAPRQVYDPASGRYVWKELCQ
jgi:hypothetical protein